LLIDLRNAIVHNRPESLTLGTHTPGNPGVPQKELDKLFERLIARNVVARPDRFTISGLFTALAQPAVARWAYNAALAMVEEIAKCLPTGWSSRILLGHDFTRVS
jgi:hypothetical protein